MRIALLLPAPGRDAERAEELSAALSFLGHEVQEAIDLHDTGISILEYPTRSLLVSTKSVPLSEYLRAVVLGYDIAAPPIHTLALLDHPLHWRRVLERVGVPLGGCAILNASQDPRRDPKVAVLGFPIVVSSLTSGAKETSREAWDREELWRAVTELRESSQTVLLTRKPTGTTITWFTGINSAEAIPASDVELDDPHRKLSHDLVNHTSRLMELRGPCRLDMVWEQDRLFLHRISHVTDLSREGAAFRAKGGDYTSFVAEIVEQAFRTQK